MVFPHLDYITEEPKEAGFGSAEEPERDSWASCDQKEKAASF